MDGWKDRQMDQGSLFSLGSWDRPKQQRKDCAKFSEAVEKLRDLLLAIPLLAVDTRQEITEAQNLIRICTQYLVGINMELHRKTLGKTSPDDLKRSLELAAYFTHCELQPGHQVNFINFFLFL